MDSLPMRSCGGRRKLYYHIQVSGNVSIEPDNPEFPPGPYKCYVEVGVDTVRKRTQVSTPGKYAWNESFEFLVREDWSICIDLIAKHTVLSCGMLSWLSKDVPIASSRDHVQLPTSTETKVVSQNLRHVHVRGRDGEPSIYQASVSLKLQLVNPDPITDPSSSVHLEESFIEDVGELIAAPNLSNTELGAFSEVLRRPSLGFGCHSFSDWSSFVVSLHSCEDDSLASPNSPHADHDEVLVSPISDLPQGDRFPPSPRELDDAEQTSVLEATLTDHTQKGDVNGGELPEIDQSSPADTVYSGTSVANDTGPQKRHKLSMKALSIRSNRSASLSGMRDRHALWGRIRSLFSSRTPQNAERIRPIFLHSSQN
ncbi:uncharacterized protein HD556DRAFT_1500371 [Suillus plorans]|uniref:C2 domain-containing protein n=1 Tax=Suillus plorans TaxID=116603 RepID=A0A9P7DDF6_9AGAM|nr:uncharacterized protein HD556DRAFT_1500371 [Suillus plorans]KAG1787930.1 hypothetical protein HD556DRAFT_1500371 [Suillus plorans]